MAQRSGEIRLRQASVGAAIADAAGPFLARRLSGVWLDGDHCRIETADREAARALARHVPMLLDRLRRRLGSLAPTSLAVRQVTGPHRARLDPRPEPREIAPQLRPLTESALDRIADPADRERLARWLRRR